MSLGLLGDYGSGSEISDSDGEYEQGSSDRNDNRTENNNTSSKTEPLMDRCSDTNEGESASAGKEIRGDPLSYIQEDESSSDDDSSSDEDTPSGDNDDTAVPLPLPDLDQLASPTSQLAAAASFTSVFSNPYKEAEEAKLAMLKRHVSDFAPDEKPSQQERTRRHKCRGSRGGKKSEAPEHRSKHALGGCSSTESQRLFNDDDSCVVMGAEVARHHGGGGGVKRKQRSGVTSTLVPPKKYLKSYGKAQAEERPWTVNQS